MIRSVLSRLPAPVKTAIRRRTALIGSVVSVRTSASDIIMTFDDGPDPLGTPAVLSALEKNRVTATFFVLMTRVRRNPALLADIRSAGHEVALHGPDHQPLTRFGYAAARRRTAEARAELEDVLGEPVRWFRPPYGRQTPATWQAVRHAGLSPVMWGPTTWDWRDVPQQERIWKSRQGARPGAIVLAHDAFAGPADGAPSSGPAPVVDREDLINRVIGGYLDLGLRPVSIGEALGRGTALHEAWFRR